MGRDERALRKDEQRVARLSGQAARLLARGSAAQALAVTGEAFGAARALAQPDPARYRALLARTLVISADALRPASAPRRPCSRTARFRRTRTPRSAPRRFIRWR